MPKKRSRKGQTAVLTDDTFIEDLEKEKKASKRAAPKPKTNAKRKKLAEVTNQQLTAVNLQIGAPFNPCFLPYQFPPNNAIAAANFGYQYVNPQLLMQNFPQSMSSPQTHLPLTLPNNLPHTQSPQNLIVDSTQVQTPIIQGMNWLQAHPPFVSANNLPQAFPQTMNWSQNQIPFAPNIVSLPQAQAPFNSSMSGLAAQQLVTQTTNLTEAQETGTSLPPNSKKSAPKKRPRLKKKIT